MKGWRTHTARRAHAACMHCMRCWRFRTLRHPRDKGILSFTPLGRQVGCWDDGGVACAWRRHGSSRSAYNIFSLPRARALHTHARARTQLLRFARALLRACHCRARAAAAAPLSLRARQRASLRTRARVWRYAYRFTYLHLHTTTTTTLPILISSSLHLLPPPHPYLYIHRDGSNLVLSGRQRQKDKAGRTGRRIRKSVVPAYQAAVSGSV